MNVPECSNCSFADMVLLSAATGLDYAIIPGLRLGVSLTGFLFGLGVAQASMDVRDPAVGTPSPSAATPSPPWPWLGLAPRLSITTVWGPSDDHQR